MKYVLIAGNVTLHNVIQFLLVSWIISFQPSPKPNNKRPASQSRSRHSKQPKDDNLEAPVTDMEIDSGNYSVIFLFFFFNSFSFYFQNNLLRIEMSVFIKRKQCAMGVINVTANVCSQGLTVVVLMPLHNVFSVAAIVVSSNTKQGDLKCVLRAIGTLGYKFPSLYLRCVL